MPSGVELDRAALVPIVCERLSTGTESLTAICKDLGFSRRQFNQWRKDDPEIDKVAAVARQEWCESIEEDILDIADNTEEGTEIVERGGKREMHTGDMLGHRKLKIYARERLLRAYNKRWSDKQQVELTGKNGGAIQHQHLPPDLSGLSNAELDQLADIAAKLAVAGNAGTDPGGKGTP